MNILKENLREFRELLAFLCLPRSIVTAIILVLFSATLLFCCWCTGIIADFLINQP